MVYVRVKDQNLLANKILLQYWKAKKRNKENFIEINDAEKFLLDFLSDNKSITFSQFYKKAKISRYKAEKILVSLLCMDIIKIHITEKQTTYSLAPTETDSHISSFG